MTAKETVKKSSAKKAPAAQPEVQVAAPQDNTPTALENILAQAAPKPGPSVPEVIEAMEHDGHEPGPPQEAALGTTVVRPAVTETDEPSIDRLSAMAASMDAASFLEVALPVLNSDSVYFVSASKEFARYDIMIAGKKLTPKVDQGSRRFIFECPGKLADRFRTHHHVASGRLVEVAVHSKSRKPKA